MKTLEDTGLLVKKKSRKVRKALGRVIKRKRSSEGAPLTENEEGPAGVSTIELASCDQQWSDVDLSETTKRLQRVTIKDDTKSDVKPGTSFDPDVIELVGVQEIETEKKKKKKKKKFSKKKARKKTWKAMKSSWKYMKAGLVMLANTSAAWSLTGAVNTVIQDYNYYPNKNFHSSEYRSYPAGTSGHRR